MIMDLASLHTIFRKNVNTDIDNKTDSGLIKQKQEMYDTTVQKQWIACPIRQFTSDFRYTSYGM